MELYESKATTTKISATSRVALKVKDNYYTIEFTEERSLNCDLSEGDLIQERSMLFDSVNQIVDNQCEDIIKTFAKK